MKKDKINQNNDTTQSKKEVSQNLDEKTKEILDAKNKEIRELKKYKALWESRNVTNSDKIVPMKG